MMKNYDQSAEINYNPNWSGYPYRIAIIGGLGSGKTNVLLNLLKHHKQILTTFICMFQSNYKLLINGTEHFGIKKLKNPKAFIDYPQIIDVYEKSVSTV